VKTKVASFDSLVAGKGRFLSTISIGRLAVVFVQIERSSG
jgi:hypothetical protein